MKKFFFSLLVAMAAGCGILAGPRIRDFKASSSYCPFEPCQVIFSWQAGLKEEERLMLRLPDGSAVPVDPVGSYEVIVGADLLTDLRIMRGSKEEERREVFIDFHPSKEILPEYEGELSRWHFKWQGVWSVGIVVHQDYMPGAAGYGGVGRLKDNSWFYHQRISSDFADEAFNKDNWPIYIGVRKVLFHEIGHGLDMARGYTHNGFKNEGCVFSTSGYYCDPAEGVANTYGVLVMYKCIKAGVSIEDLLYLADWAGEKKNIDKSCIPDFSEATPQMAAPMAKYLQELRGGQGPASLKERRYID